MSAAATFEEPGAVRGLEPGESAESPVQAPARGRVALYGVVLVGGIAVGEAVWLAGIAYAVYLLFS